MALDDFIRETELAGLEFYTNQMVSLNLISTLFDNTVPSIAFDWIKSDNMERWVQKLSKFDIFQWYEINMYLSTPKNHN